MKKHLLQSLLAAFALLLVCGNVWGDSYTITFKTGTGDGSTIDVNSTSYSDIVSDGADYLSGIPVTATKVYCGGSNGLKLGASSSAGELKMNLAVAGQVTPASIVVKAKLYNASKAATISINDATAQNLNSDFADYTFSFSNNTAITYLQLKSSKYCWVESITVNYTAQAPKTLTGISVSGTAADIYTKDAFTHEGITVTATWDDNTTTDVTADAEYTGYNMEETGDQTVTVSYNGQTATYGVTVKSIANTQTTAYTVAQAKALIDAGKGLKQKVYVQGIVSKVDSYNSTYNSITYWISEDGSTTNQFEFYGGLKSSDESDHFTSKDDVTVGDEVIGYGKMKKYSSTYEFDANNYLVSQIRFTSFSIANVTVANNAVIKLDITTNIPEGSYTITYESHNTDAVDVEDGNLVTKGIGEARITATIEAEGYQTKEYIFTVTVIKTLVSIALSGEPKSTYTIGEQFDKTGLVVTGTYDNDETEDLTANASWDIEPATLTNAGQVAVTVTAEVAGKSDSKEYTVTVNKKVSSINISDITMMIGDEVAIVAATTPSEATLSYEITAGNSYASIADGTITGVAKGTATVKATYAGSDEYASTETTFTVTVNDPNDFITKTIFYESFNDCDGTGGNDGKWSGSIASNNFAENKVQKADNQGWEVVKEGAASQCLKLGAGSSKGSATTPAITLSGDATLSFRAAAWNGNSEETTLNISATAGTLSTSSVTMTKGAWTAYTITITGVSESTKITFAGKQASNNRFFLDDVKVEQTVLKQAQTIDVSSVGWATACLPFAAEVTTSGAKAYYVSVAGTALTKTEVTGVIPSGTGVLVSGAEGTVTFTEAVAGEEDIEATDGNMLIGTCQEDGQTFNASNTKYYILANDPTDGIGFYWQSGTNGTSVTCGQYKAVLAVSSEQTPRTIGGGGTEDPEDPTKIRGFRLDGTTMVEQMLMNNEDAAIYDLLGRKVENATKGIYIMNGKKIFVK